MLLAASSAPTSSSSSSTSPVATPVNRGIMSSPFTVIQGRPEHGFVHIHSQPTAHSVRNRAMVVVMIVYNGENCDDDLDE